MNENLVNVIGAGLAGSEAAWQLACRGVRVRLHEMRPVRMTEAHQTGMFGELVCSNSLRNDSMETAVGVLKEEMRRLRSLIIATADRVRVPAGSALAVDREEFARILTETLAAHPLVEIVRAEATSIPSGPTIIATGPLTSAAFGEELNRIIGSRNLYFYDAIAPIVTSSSVDMNIAYMASRWGKGGEDYINCPLDKQQYEAFVAAVMAADKVAAHPFEKQIYFEGCMPIEEIARRGPMTLAFGPMRPVGLDHPHTGARPFAVVQLRQDDGAGRLFNMVGFQTKMTYPEQRRVLRMIPGLEHAEFVRLGSLHRNTFIDSPRLLRPTMQFRGRDDLFIAGQMVGVEGYVESAAAGMLAAINASRLVTGREFAVPPPETAIGSLVAYITDATRRDFQPMNANYGLMPDLKSRARGREKKIEMGARAIAAFENWITRNELQTPEADSADAPASLPA
jgi:methylenetetrahydrofolate--tRNA-(uracil-5-)-methyltransferase